MSPRDWSRPETLQDRIDRDGVDTALGLKTLYPATVTATPAGKDRYGKPLTRVERHEIRKAPEPFGLGRSRIFVRRVDLDVRGSYPRYAPMVVLTESIKFEAGS
jgi:hypothetical protein